MAEYGSSTVSEEPEAGTAPGWLSRAIAPVYLREFFAHYWQQEPLFARREPSPGGPGNDVLDVPEVDELISSTPGDGRGWLTLVRGGQTIDHAQLGSPDQLVDRAKVLAAFDAGYTVLLTKLHRRSRAVAELCRSLEETLYRHGVRLSTRIGANSYLTPPQSQGFPAHYDDHDVLVIQLAGRKTWQIYRPVTALPLDPPEGPLPASQIGPLVEHREVKAGELMYIPRGYPHAATAETSQSLHLTISIYPQRWADVLAEVAPAELGLREALPRAFEEAPVGPTELRARAEQAANQQAIDTALRRCEEHFFESMTTLPCDGFGTSSAPRSIDMDTQVTPAPGVFFGVASDHAGCSLMFPGSGYRASLAAQTAFRFIAESDTFKVGELPDLSETSKGRLVEELVRRRALRLIG